jgi:RNA polymerase sigma-70 factor, ECF subfamily
MELKITTLIKDGNHKKALRLMADAYSKQIGRFCTGLVGSSSDAEELLQETFIRAWKALPRFRGESTVRAWLFGIAKKVCASHLRKRDRRSNILKRFFSGGGEAVSKTVEGVERIERTQTQIRVNEAILELKLKLREAVLLHYHEGMKTAEIAEILDITPANARKRISLGIRALRESLRPLLMEPLNSEEREYGNGKKESLQTYSGPRLVDTRKSK